MQFQGAFVTKIGIGQIDVIFNYNKNPKIR